MLFSTAYSDPFQHLFRKPRLPRPSPRTNPIVLTYTAVMSDYELAHFDIQDYASILEGDMREIYHIIIKNHSKKVQATIMFKRSLR